MKGPKDSTKQTPVAATALAVLLQWATPEVLEIVRERLCSTPEKFALMLVKAINPDEILTKQEDATRRGVDRKTLRGRQARGEV